MEPSDSACHRSYFYVGGTYVEDENSPGERVMQGQMYVEQLTPLGGSRHQLPLIFIHGGGQTASVCHPFGFKCICECARLGNGIIIIIIIFSLLTKVTTCSMIRIIIFRLNSGLLNLIDD